MTTTEPMIDPVIDDMVVTELRRSNDWADCQCKHGHEAEKNARARAMLDVFAMPDIDRAIEIDLVPCRHDPLAQNPGRNCDCKRSNPVKGDAIATVDKYVTLENVLHRALEQARNGKGAERHATDQSFDRQPMLGISRMIGSHHGLLYQAIKKAQESTRLPTSERQVAELLGAINYLAGAIIFLESPKCM